MTNHAIARYREHYPAADIRALLEDLASAEEIAPALAQTMTARAVRPTADRYLLSKDRTGMFVLEESRVITYLRFGDEQRAFAEAHWPVNGASPPAPDPPAETDIEIARAANRVHPALGVPLTHVAIAHELRVAVGMMSINRLRVSLLRAELVSEVGGGARREVVFGIDHDGRGIGVRCRRIAKDRWMADLAEGIGVAPSAHREHPAPAGGTSSGAPPAGDVVTGVLAMNGGPELVYDVLGFMGAVCDACGCGTRVTSRKWAKCKRCGKRVERRELPGESKR